LLGVAAPDLTHPFRYADLGCGNGATALVVAATMPHAEVWGFDFNPAHVEAGRDVARRAGLANIRFEEASFDDLANRPADALPVFDYITAHGVLSWISLENRRRLFAVIGQRLAPGGIVYISYNVSTGWTGIRPVRSLMRLLVEASPERTDQASAHIFDVLDKMRDAGAAMFREHPALHARLSAMREHDNSYVAHELLNRDWHPAMFPAIATEMAAIKCGYLGSATPRDNRPGLTMPRALLEMFGRIRDPGTRETVRDVASAASFRRDLYQRGPRHMSLTEQNRRIGAIGLVRTFKAAPAAFTAHPELCQVLVEVLDAGPRTMSGLHRHASIAGFSAEALLEAVISLLTDGYLAPMLSEAPDVAAAAALNEVHAVLYDQGYDRPFLAYPALGSAWPTDCLQILAVDALRNGHRVDEHSLIDTVLARVTRAGRQLRRDGEVVSDPASVREGVAERIRDMLRHQLPTMRRLGVLDTVGSTTTEAA
jgi:SAM-dependent methyltransferase